MTLPPPVHGMMIRARCEANMVEGLGADAVLEGGGGEVTVLP